MDIRQARMQAGLLQNELAERLGVTASLVSQWENGVRKPRPSTLKRIAKALAINVTSLSNAEHGEQAATTWHNAKTEPPKVSEWYLTIKFIGDLAVAATYYYDVERKGWEVGIGTDPDNRQWEKFPHYWADQPTRAQLEGGKL